MDAACKGNYHRRTGRQAVNNLADALQHYLFLLSVIQVMVVKQNHGKAVHSAILQRRKNNAAHARRGAQENDMAARDKHWGMRNRPVSPCGRRIFQSSVKRGFRASDFADWAPNDADGNRFGLMEVNHASLLANSRQKFSAGLRKQRLRSDFRSHHNAPRHLVCHFPDDCGVLGIRALVQNIQ